MEELLRKEEEKTRMSTSKDTGSSHDRQQGILTILHYITNLKTKFM